MALVRRVDPQGRVALPSRWRARALKDVKEVVMLEQGDRLLIRPRGRVDLTKYFDSVVVDVRPEAFGDYNALKGALHGGRFREVR